MYPSKWKVGKAGVKEHFSPTVITPQQGSVYFRHQNELLASDPNKKQPNLVADYKFVVPVKDPDTKKNISVLSLKLNHMVYLTAWDSPLTYSIE